MNQNILKTINSPEDVRNLSIADLNQLAADIREEIVKTVSKTGGHLGKRRFDHQKENLRQMDEKIAYFR